MSSKRPAAKKKKKKPGFLGVTARLVMLVIAGLLALSYLSILVSPASLWFLSIFGLLFIPLALVDLVLLVWAIFRRSSSFWIPLLALIPAFFFIGEYVNVHNRSDETPEVKIISYNVGRFGAAQDGVERSEEACLDEVLSRLNQENADIICLQEFRVGRSQDIKAICKRYFPTYECAYFAFPGTRSKVGNVTLSRFPVRSRSSQTFEESTNLVLYTDINMG
ncbi:MAG: endonuclease/exonuclease/phosphatase family protein, partial [Bacteroidales bacterium]|nr:endonuclease/exonuclease/phosphatase family protein [Bacteroidales bacterium]